MSSHDPYGHAPAAVPDIDAVGEPIIADLELSLRQQVFKLVTKRETLQPQDNHNDNNKPPPIDAYLDRFTDANKFPGAQPISLGNKQLKEIVREKFFVSEKADGIRCLLYTVKMGSKADSYLIDRKNKYYKVNLQFPSMDQKTWLSDTVLDGELVMDVEQGADGKQKTQLYFLLFDCLVWSGKNLCPRTYDKRLGYLKDFVLKPFQWRCKQDPQYEKSLPFKIDLKKLELSYKISKVFDYIQTLKHGNDGLIFTKVNAPYFFGTCDSMLKWKPVEENTVDFRVRVETRHPGGEKRYILQVWLDAMEHEDLTELITGDELSLEWERHPPNMRIIECRYDPNWPNHWRFMRFRDDKNTGNHKTTYIKIMRTIHDAVTKDVMVSLEDRIKPIWGIKVDNPSSSASQQHNRYSVISDTTSTTDNTSNNRTEFYQAPSTASSLNSFDDYQPPSSRSLPSGRPSNSQSHTQRHHPFARNEGSRHQSPSMSTRQSVEPSEAQVYESYRPVSPSAGQPSAPEEDNSSSVDNQGIKGDGEHEYVPFSAVAKLNGNETGVGYDESLTREYRAD